ncbi:hypothetical protein ECTOBSL9_1250 [Ectothiorhodospira sp. BSL-9]|nr:hypothetical protein ECTOBSL9_1250 [Ectothiorhodospira sp. BSL-9]
MLPWLGHRYSRELNQFVAGQPFAAIESRKFEKLKRGSFEELLRDGIYKCLASGLVIPNFDLKPIDGFIPKL